jgi:hypothetical protein
MNEAKHVYTAESESSSPLVQSKKETLWEVLGDASQEHPDVVFRRLSEQTPQERRRLENSLRIVRRMELSAYVDTEQAAGIPDTHSSMPLVEAQLADIEQILRNNSQEFNVTTSIEYNVSSPLDKTGTEENDTSTVIYTQSEPKNSTSMKNATDAKHNSTIDTAPLTHFPIRIRAFLADIAGGGEHLTLGERNHLLQDIVRPALLSWSSALRVDPVEGNLTVDRHQLTDGKTCGPGVQSGLPSVPVPVDHFTMGVADTDMVLYISLAFAKPVETVRPTPAPTSSAAPSGSLAPSGQSSVVPSGSRGNDSSKVLQSQNYSNRELTDSETIAPRDTGTALSDDEVPNDKKMSDSMNTTNSTEPTPKSPKVECTGDYLAASAFCSTDQFDRPTAAILHICIGESFFDPVHIHKNILVVQHELGHALGFNAVSLAHFRRADGSPITPRNKRGEVRLKEIECTGPAHDRRWANVTLPSEEILQFRTVRGGVRVAQVVSPSVAQVARNHFDCQELDGAELESGEILPRSTNQDETTCLGDHWERRLFKTDLMNPVIETKIFNPRISTITLAYFADSGWYQVDLARATTAGGWGRGAGCSFVDDPCIDANGQVPPKFAQFFCNHAPRVNNNGYSDDLHGCTQDLTQKAVCTIGQYDQELPPEYQYFHFEGGNIGGSDPYMDYCPVYAGYSNGLCSDPLNDAVIRVDRVERIGGRNSRCLEGRMGLNKKTAFCLPIACVMEDRTLRIQIDGVWQVCSEKGKLLPTGRSGTFVTCPDPVRICPTFYCYRDCLGTYGRCDFEVGQCVCNITVANTTDCKPEQEKGPQFYDSTPLANFSVAEPDSPLADIYVNDARALKEEGRSSIFSSWEGPLLIFGASCTILAAVLYLRCRSKIATDAPVSGPDLDFDDDGNQGVAAMASNKHKMIATVVVDLRMNNIFLFDPLREERASETEVSMTDTEGASSQVTNLSLGPDEIEEDLDAKPAAVIRRRHVAGSLS